MARHGARSLPLLARALTECFDGSSRILWNAPPTPDARNGARRRFRFDAAHHEPRPAPDPSDPPILAVPSRMLVARVRGLLDARRALQDEDAAWIVVVVRDQEGNASPLLDDLQQLTEHAPRLLVLRTGAEWTGELRPPGPDEPTDDAALDALRVWLAKLRFEDRSEVVAPLEPVPEPRSTDDQSSLVADLLDESLVDRGMQDLRLVLVGERGAVSFPRFTRLLPERSFEIRAVDESTLAWCAGLSDGGCRLVLSLRDESLRHLHEDFLDALRGTPGVTVVVESRSHAGNGSALPDRLAPFVRDADGLEDPLAALAADAGTAGPLQILVFPPAETPPRALPARQDATGNAHAAFDLAARCGFSPESLRHEHECVLAAKLSPDVESWYRTYRKVGHRTRYLWQWCVHGAELTALPGIAAELRDHVRDTKVLSIMLCVLLDDAADEIRDPALLESLLQVIDDPDGSGAADSDTTLGDRSDYLQTTLTLARAYHDRVRSYPQFAEFEDLLRFDQWQYFNTMRYSCLLNRHVELLNPTEHDLYLPHAMHMMSFSTLDLMCSPKFDVEELGHFREAMWHAQNMGRVGNVLATWRREIPVHDFTSGVFAAAATDGSISLGDLRDPNPAELERRIVQSRQEEFWLARWFECRDRFIRKIPAVRTVNLREVLVNQERFFRMHLGSRGLI